VDSVPVIWQNCECASDLAELSVVEELASDLAGLPVPVIRQNCLYVEEHASDLAELPVPVIWYDCLYI
jgi:hypothetical protein